MSTRTTKKDRETAARWLPQLYCSHEECTMFEQVNKGNIRFRRREGKQPSQLQFSCRECGCRFTLRKHTPLYGLKMAEETFELIIKCLCKGNGIRGTAEIVGVKPDTVLGVIERMGAFVERTLEFFVRDLWSVEVQFDELWTFIEKKQGNLTDVEKLRTEFGHCWIWVAFDPETKVILGFVLGKRTKKNAVRLVRRVREVIDLPVLPLFTSDELPAYEDALLEVFGVREGDRKVPPPDLNYAVVHKTRERGRIVDVDRRIVFGDEEEIAKIIDDSVVSHTVNTSFIERDNLQRRASCGRLARKSLSFSKCKTKLRHGLTLCIAYDMLCRSHGGLREKLSKRERQGNRKWRYRSPLMAAQKTDHIWSVTELILFRPPPGRYGRCRYSGRSV